MKHFLIVASLFLAGCSHWNGITPLGSDTYMVSLLADSIDPAGTQTMAYRLAGTHCAAQGREVRTVETTRFPNRATFDEPLTNYDMIFRCIESAAVQSGASVTPGTK